MKKIILSLTFIFLVIVVSVSFAKTKYVPKGGKLTKTMQNYNKALGQNCTFCHVSNKATSIDDITKYKPKDLEKMKHKRVARAMIGQIQMFNEHHNLTITCMDCHQGSKNPPVKE